MINQGKYLSAALITFLLTVGMDMVYGQHFETDAPDSLNRNRLRMVIITESALYGGGLLFLNNIWYKNHEAVPFHFYNDWPGWIQVDKAGHMYSAYHQSLKGIEILRWAGVSRKKTIIYGGSLGLLMQTPIEIFDGLYEGYGFSVTDMIANTMGSALVVGQELFWQEQRIRMKFSYHPTKYAKYRPSYFGKSKLTNFFTDYNGHTYWLSANLSKFFPEKKLPEWFNVAFGYGANGMLAEFKNPEFSDGRFMHGFERTRQLYLSLDIELSALSSRSKFLKGLFKAINMLKFPAPALEFNSSEGLIFHPVYF